MSFPKLLEFARTHYQADNVEFTLGDINSDLELGAFDVVVLSNILEHLPGRVDLLRRVQGKVNPGRVLIRVPMYEREWMVPLKEELGVEFTLDPSHKIEHTQEQFFDELREAGLHPECWEIRWRELWCRAVPAKKS